MGRTYDAVVIGAGSFGSWAAWHLRKTGRSVLLVDAWGPAHSRASSGGESRLIRMGYGADAIYTRMAWRSLSLWHELFRRTGKQLFHRTGVLWMAREDHPNSTATRAVLTELGLPMEILTAGDLSRRYPQMRISDPGVFGILEPESGALMARRAVAAVVEDAVADGVDYLQAGVTAPRQGGRPGELRTTSGESIAAGDTVFACGPWLPKLFPELLADRIFPTRQEVFFFAPPAGSGNYGPAAMPAWIDFTEPRGPYGFPDLESRGFKLAFDEHGVPFDPDAGDRRVSDAGLAAARGFLAERFPELENAVLNESRVCQYENTFNGDFLIDRHPTVDNVWIAGGGSGHGFKHGPAVGEYLAERIGGAVGEERFKFGAPAQLRLRTVY